MKRCRSERDAVPENVGYAVKVSYLRPLLESAPKIEGAPRAIVVSGKAALPDLAARVQGSVLFVLCE
jgi:hypothetical protein